MAKRIFSGDVCIEIICFTGVIHLRFLNRNNYLIINSSTQFMKIKILNIDKKN